MNKSMVFSIGNRLAPLCENRRAAFLQAWAIVKAGGVTMPVRGVTFGSRQEALKRLATYAPEKIRTFLMPETDNPADSHAVAVMVGVQNGRGYYKLGYIPAVNTGLAAAVRGRVSISVLAGDIHSARVRVRV